MKLIDLYFIQKILDKFGLVLVAYYYSKDDSKEFNFPENFPYKICIKRKNEYK